VLFIYRIACVLIGYLFGCIQTAYFLGRKVSNIDIREHGSGSAGMTNAFRVMGGNIGVIVFVVDFFKAAGAFLLCSSVFNGIVPGLYAGAGVLLGHNYPFFLTFKGGKGVASFLGLMLVLDWRSACVIYAVGVAIIAFTRYVSLASLVMTLLAPILLLIFKYPPEVYYLTSALAVMTWFQHRGNIKRLIAGKERRFSFTKSNLLDEKG
jgi:glycerol-3-phosphate acyltransferase PlsY